MFTTPGDRSGRRKNPYTTSAQLAAALTDETGSGPAVFGTSPTLTTPVISGLLDLSSGSSGQIKFPATQNASANANTLDDYEEGTFTPALTFATPGNLSVSYAAQSGAYTKIGRIVIYDMLINAPTFTHTTASSYLQVTGLPFACASSFAGAGSVVMNGYTKAGFHMLVMETASGGGSFFYVVAGGSGVSRAELVAADLPTGTLKEVFASGCYAA